MTETAPKNTVRVKIDFKRGPMTPHMRACWKKWWAARIAAVKSEAVKHG